MDSGTFMRGIAGECCLCGDEVREIGFAREGKLICTLCALAQNPDCLTIPPRDGGFLYGFLGFEGIYFEVTVNKNLLKSNLKRWSLSEAFTERVLMGTIAEEPGESVRKCAKILASYGPSKMKEIHQANLNDSVLHHKV